MAIFLVLLFMIPWYRLCFFSMLFCREICAFDVPCVFHGFHDIVSQLALRILPKALLFSTNKGHHDEDFGGTYLINISIINVVILQVYKTFYTVYFAWKSNGQTAVLKWVSVEVQCLGS